MLISVITPTHRTDHLLSTYASLQNQAYRKFEWILLPNGACGTLPGAILEDPRVRVIQPAPGLSGNVGALKQVCCAAARGELLVELDHDDLLHSTALTRLAAAYCRHIDGFFYSDVAYFRDEEGQPPVVFDPLHGWEDYEMTLDGVYRVAMKAFPITPRSLSEVLYAPDHVRAWSRRAYDRAGGHDGDQPLLDDLDLMIRTYLAGVPFVYLDSCEYFYRYHASSTSQQRADEITKLGPALRDKYFAALMQEWLRREGLEKLQLTAGEYYSLGKLPESSYGQIVLEPDFLPTLTGDQATLAMNAIYRALVPGGYLTLAAPYSRGSLADAPHYQSHWNKHSLEYYTDQRFARQLPGSISRFQLVRYELQDLSPAEPSAYRLQLTADLAALKGQRQPGIIKI